MKSESFVKRIELKDRNGRVVGTKDVTYQGLLSRAHDEGLKRVTTELVQAPSDANDHTAIARVTVETGKGTFAALGDANPENVNSFIVPHLIRMAETRAKARALRDAVNVGILSAEEVLGEDVPSNLDTAQRVRSRGDTENDDTFVGDGPPPVGTGGFVPITENQRRYLFRILATLGHHGDAANDYLTSRFAIKSLATVSKGEAVGFIAKLLEDTRSAPNATTQR